MARRFTELSPFPALYAPPSEQVYFLRYPDVPLDTLWFEDVLSNSAKLALTLYPLE